jgi:hypothetical protein
MKFKLLLAVVVSTTLLATSGASAFITAPAPGTWVSLTQCLTAGSITRSSAQTTYLRIGWGSITEAQAYNFLAAQSGTMTVTGNNSVVTTQWPTGSDQFWTVPTLISAPGNKANGGRPLWFTAAYLPVGGAPGTYTISLTTPLAKNAYDGVSVIRRGSSWFTVSNCTLILT